jgi:hypothetical protein
MGQSYDLGPDVSRPIWVGCTISMKFWRSRWARFRAKGQGSVDMGLFAKAKEPFLRGFLKLENGVPSHATPELAEGQPAFSARSGAVPGGVSAVHDGLQQNDSCQAGRRRRS